MCYYDENDAQEERDELLYRQAREREELEDEIAQKLEDANRQRLEDELDELEQEEKEVDDLIAGLNIWYWYYGPGSDTQEDGDDS